MDVLRGTGGVGDAWLMDTDLAADERAARCVRMMQEVVTDLPEPAQLGAVMAMLDALGEWCSAEVGSVPLWLTRVVEKVESYRLEEGAVGCAEEADPGSGKDDDDLW